MSHTQATKNRDHLTVIDGGRSSASARRVLRTATQQLPTNATQHDVVLALIQDGLVRVSHFVNGKPVFKTETMPLELPSEISQ